MQDFLLLRFKKEEHARAPIVPLREAAYRDASFRSTRAFSRIPEAASRDTHGQWQVPIFETSVCARACNDHRPIPRQEEEQVFHFSPAYRPTLTSSSSILRMSAVRREKEERGKEGEKTVGGGKTTSQFEGDERWKKCAGRRWRLRMYVQLSRAELMGVGQWISGVYSRGVYFLRDETQDTEIYG